jgi:hypothetical protein
VLEAVLSRNPERAAVRMSEHLDAVVRWHQRLDGVAL